LTSSLCIHGGLPPLRTPLFPYTTLFRSTRWKPAGGRRGWLRRLRRRGIRELRKLTWLRLKPAAGEQRDRVGAVRARRSGGAMRPDRKSTRLNSSHVKISYAVFCLKKKNG